MEKSNLVKTFMDLVAIPSPSGHELLVGKYIQNKLNKLGVGSYFDKTGRDNDSNSGNLIAVLRGDINLPTLLFVAHMDTVEKKGFPIIPIIKNQIITSSGDTVLGADDKASIACLLSMISRLVSAKKFRPTIIIAFTTREEDGIMGSSLLNIQENVDYCFNVDGSNQFGDFVYKTLGEIPFEIKIIGKSAHAASEPERGIHAIIAASKFINSLSIGKKKNGDILSIGKIEGGTSVNIVPDSVLVKGQVRSYSEKGLNSMLENLKTKLDKVSQITKCKFEIILYKKFGAPPSTTSINSRIIDIARSAIGELGITLSLSRGSFTSDANFLSKKYPTLTIGRGSSHPHSYEESISIDSLYKLENLILSIVKCSTL